MRRLLIDEDDDGRHDVPLCLATTGEKRDGFQQRAGRVSYRKPLFSISHRISERRNTPSLEQQQQQAGHGAATQLNFGVLSSKLQTPKVQIVLV